MQSMSRTVLRVPRALLIGIFLFSLGIPQSLGADGLEKALKSGKKEVKFSGKEKEDVRIPKGVRVTGSGPGKAVISGDISMADGSSLANVTVNGGRIAITIDKGASVSLTNVTVTGSSDAGIFAPKGGGTLTITNSRIQQNRKGIFLLSGKRLALSGSSITNNQEEGLDMHAGTGGSINGNTFANNKEGGMEVIINGSSFTISGNTFSGNASSGIALQSYGGGGGGAKTGSFVIRENTFANNGNFGIDCKNPLGTGGAFFGASAKASDNTFTANKKGPTNGECGIRNRIAVEEVTDEDSEPAKSLGEELREEEEMNSFSQEVQSSAEPLEALQKEVAVLENEAGVYTQKKIAQPKAARLIAQPPEEKLSETRLLRKQTHLKQKVESCSRVTTYAVSIDTARNLLLCTKEDKQALKITLEEIASQVRTRTYQEKVGEGWRYFTERLLASYRDWNESSGALL